MTSEPQTSTQSFTAAQIALALGLSKRWVLSALRSTPAGRVVVVSGNPASAWDLCALPAAMQERLNSQAAKLSYRNAEQLLLSPQQTWHPAVAFKDASPRHQEKAAMLQKALAPALARINDLSISEADFEAIGLAGYKQAFGFSISARHWRRLFHRTVARDAGVENWGRLDIYLDDNAGTQAADNATGQVISIPALQKRIASFRDPSKPSSDEVAMLWVSAFEEFDRGIAAGKPQKREKRRLLAFLEKSSHYLAGSPAGLRKQWDRKYSAWVRAGRIPSAVTDQRPHKSGFFRAPDLSKPDVDGIVGHAVFQTGSRVSQAWRDVKDKLGPEVSGHYLANPRSKSHVPRKIRDLVQPKVRLVKNIHRGPQQAKLNGAYIDRDWSPVFTGDAYQADDVTLPVYYYEPDGNGWYSLMRGQCLIMIDLRSTRILDFILLSSRSYNARAIRTLMTRSCDEFGLPRYGFVFEGGIWETSRLITGGKAYGTAFSNAEVEKGFRDIGLKFIHARSARVKLVERVIGAAQDLMEATPGYVGRDERKDKFERVQKAILAVKARRMNPSDVFLSANQWVSRLHEICTKYNATPQDGKLCEGLSPDAAFVNRQKTSDPQTKLPAWLRYKLSHHGSMMRVTRNGIRLPRSFGGGVYRNEKTGWLVNQKVLVWFDQEIPDSIVVTDLDQQNPFIVEKSQKVPGLGAPPDLLSQELRRAAQHNAPAKAYYRALRLEHDPNFRRVFATPETVKLGQEIEELQSRLNEEKKQAADRRRQEAALLRRIRSTPLTEQDVQSALEFHRGDAEKQESAIELYRMLKPSAEDDISPEPFAVGDIANLFSPDKDSDGPGDQISESEPTP